MSERQTAQRVLRVIWRLLKLPAKALYALGLDSIQGRLVLLLTTIWRKSGLPRVTPLQFEEVDGNHYVAFAQGDQADWYRNPLANSTVKVQVRSRRYDAVAEPIMSPEQIADFLELRLSRHPRLMASMFRAQGYRSNPGREQLEAYAAKRAMVVLRPIESG